jgi:hypothetical protein
MGLDMYLHARKYVSGQNYNRDEQGNFTITPNPALDTVIESVGLSRHQLDEDTPSAIVSIKVLQWRKANHIHEWFVQNVQAGEDECNPHYVSREKLEDLLTTLGHLLKAKQEGADQSTFEDILPTQAGFFFGSTDYDEYYWEEVERTYEAINKLLNNHDLEDFDFEYSSSW